MKFCPNCGAQVNEDAKFCPNCGYSFEKMATPEENANFTTGAEEGFTDKMKSQFNRMATDEQIELQLETAEGLNMTRGELKTEAQKKLSGRYGEWFKTNVYYLIAIIVSMILFNLAFTKSIGNLIGMGMGYMGRSLMDELMPFGDSYGYGGYSGYGGYGGYGYGYGPSGLSIFLWVVVLLLVIVFMVLLSALIRAVFQWCGIFTLRGKRADGLAIFNYFIKAQKKRILAANVLVAIYTFLWSLLFVIPGIVKTASYAMTNYLLEKDPTLQANEAITLSRQIMKGYKLEYLILMSSFFLWFALMAIPGGFLLAFYVYPYYYTTEMKFLDTLYERYLDNQKAAAEVVA